MASQAFLAVTSTPPQTTDLSSDQSLALVKIFVNASLACICHARELLDWSSDCFNKRFIDDVSLVHDPEEIYNSFCSLESPSTKPSQEVRVLVHSQNTRANSILDMMEAGVFDALSHSYLDVLHVFVTSKSSNDNPIYESYTYTFAYEGSHVTSVSIGEIGKTFTLADSQKSFKAAIRALLRTMKELPGLPKHRALGMSMSFRANCPVQYQPEGFRSSDAHSIAPTDWDSLWQPPSITTTSFETANHVIKIAARNKEYEDQSTSQLQDTLLSKQIHNLQRTSSNRNLGVRSTIPVPSAPGQDTGNVKRMHADEELQRPHGVGDRCFNAVLTDAVRDEAKPSPGRRKISVSGRFIAVSRSSPASVAIDDEHDTYAARKSYETDRSDDSFS